MQCATAVYDGREAAGIIVDNGWIPIVSLNDRLHKKWSEDMLGLLVAGHLDEIREWHDALPGDERAEMQELARPIDTLQFAPLYRRPRKIWGIGLNYKAHADGLSEKVPDAEPASFMKPDTTIVGYGEAIRIPKLSERTTGEAELGLIFGKTCRDVDRSDWKSVLAGFTTIIDMTAEDILRRNPRNLTQSKSFDTFFSFGPILYTVDEIDDIMGLTVRTVLNGSVKAENTVSNMTFPPDVLVSYHSQIMTMLPGDVLSSGTPGAVPLKDGDRIECRIGDLHPLVNPVIDDKV